MSLVVRQRQKIIQSIFRSNKSAPTPHFDRRLLSRASPARINTARPFSISIANMTSSIEHVSTTESAPPAGPYSQAIKANGMIFVSGQIPFDKNGNLVDGGIAEHTTQCCENIKAILTASGTDLSKVVKVHVYLSDMDNFVEMNDVYAKYFTNKPARACVAVKTLPKNVDVEIDCIALA